MRKGGALPIVVASLLLLAGCSTSKMPPFATASRWTLDGNEVSSAVRGMSINFGGTSPFALSNMSDGDYDLHFITSDAQYQAYATHCKRYINSVIKQIPLKIDSLELVLADQFVVFTPSANSQCRPDLIRRADGAEIVCDVLDNAKGTFSQPHDEIWRNVVFNNGQHLFLVVDRLVKNGKPIAIAYIIQGDDKHVPFSGTYHYDVTSRRNTQPVGEQMRWLLDITIAASGSQVMPLSYGDYIYAADSCFMAGDYAGASRQFEKAFAVSADIPDSHLYNAACAAALAGQSDFNFFLFFLVFPFYIFS